METTTVLKPRRIDSDVVAGGTLAADVFGADRLGVVILVS